MQGRLQDAAESYVNWWALSGVDMTFVPEPIAYATENVATLARQGDKISAPDSVTEQTISREVPGNPASAPAPEAQPLALPDSLPEMLRYLAEQELFIGPLAAPHKILPAGEAGAGVMVITDMPDADDMAAGHLLAGASGRLLDAMLKAIGLSRSQCFFSSLAFTRIPGGRVDARDAKRMAAIQRKLISLVAPAHLLLLGDKTSRALTGMDLHEARGWLRDVNHPDGTIAAVTTFHPRFLLQRPQLKRAAWEDLKRLKKGIDDRA